MSDTTENWTGDGWEEIERPGVFRLALALLAVALYAQCATFSLIPGWDDWVWFVDRETVRSWWAVPWSQRLLTPGLGYPVPIPTAIWAAIREWPLATATSAAHITNVVFHTISTLLAFELGRRWLDSSLAAAAVAAVWTSHPLMAESVAWVTNLKTVGFGTYFLGTLVLWEDQVGTPTGWRAVIVSASTLACFGFRPEAVVLPAIMLLRMGSSRRNWGNREILLPLGLSLVAVAIYAPMAFLGHAEILSSVHQEASRTLTDRLYRTGAALWLQAKHTVIPVELHPMYPVGSLEELRRLSARGWALVIPLGAGFMWAWRRSRPTRPWLILMFLTYLPACGFLYLPRGTADTYMYLPLFGLIGALVALFRDFDPLFKRPWKLLPSVGLPALILCLGLLTGLQLQRWSSPLQLWQPMTESYPNYDKPYRSLGLAHYKIGAYEEAVQVFEKGLEAMRRENSVPLVYPEALVALDRIEEARAILLELKRRRPDLQEQAEELLGELPED
jgi:hypothetical protein